MSEPRRRTSQQSRIKPKRAELLVGADRLLKRVLVEVGQWTSLAPLCDDIRALRKLIAPHAEAILKATEEPEEPTTGIKVYTDEDESEE